MNPKLLPMAPVQIVDIVGSTAMIVFALLCVHNALRLKRKDPQNVIWTYLLWFSSALLIFSISRSGSHLLKYLTFALDDPRNWFIIRPVTGSLNTISFVIVGAITLFFSRVYSIYSQIQEDKSAIERAHEEIVQLNVNLEKMVQERTRDLSVSEEKYRRVFEGSKDMLFICDEKGHIQDINHFGVELLGFADAREVLGRNFLGEFVIQPEAMSIMGDVVARDFLKDVELKLKKRNGDELVGLFSATLRKIDGGRPAGFEGTVKDITMRKTMERQLLQADKLASLGQLSAGVAHEINNPLGLILGYTQLILKEAKGGSQLCEDLKVIEKHALHCKKIVEDLLKFSRSTSTAKTPVDLNELLGEVLEVVETNFELDNVHIRKRLSPGLPSVTVDPDKIKQVFMNILMNARQSIKGSGSITIATAFASEDHHIDISFADTGSGIPADMIDKIFDPFFTTKPTGMGTGLGLSVSYGIVKDHDGEIRVESLPGKGSTFRIHLPVRAESGERGAEPKEKYRSNF